MNGFGDTRTVELRPDLIMLDTQPGQAYLLRRGTTALGAPSVLLVDTGRPGLGAAVEAALARWGLGRDALTHVVLTHWHPDHAGSAAEISTWPEVSVIAHHHDAPVIRGDQAGPRPVLTDAEQSLWDQLGVDLDEAPPARVDLEVDDDTWIDDVRARVVATPGHTPGSIALHVPDAGVLFTGDIAAAHDGTITLGTFNTDRAAAHRSLRRLGQVQALTAVCFGHGPPLLGTDTAALTQAANTEPPPDPLG